MLNFLMIYKQNLSVPNYFLNNLGYGIVHMAHLYCKLSYLILFLLRFSPKFACANISGQCYGIISCVSCQLGKVTTFRPHSINTHYGLFPLGFRLGLGFQTLWLHSIMQHMFPLTQIQFRIPFPYPAQYRNPCSNPNLNLSPAMEISHHTNTTDQQTKHLAQVQQIPSYGNDG